MVLHRIFRSSDINIKSSYPKQLEKDVEIQFYIVLPSGNDIRKNSTTVLPKGTVDNILEANSTLIGLVVNAKIKTDAEGNTSKPAVDNTLDYIMIPVSFGLLLLVIILACCLHFCQ
jgi:hypothetical protein